MSLDFRWPLATIIIILAIIWFFRDDIRQIIPRVSKAGPTGVEFVNQPGASGHTTIPDKLDDIPDLEPTLSVKQREQVLKSAIQELPEAQRVDRLISVLAQAQVAARFSELYGLIFGSQIEVLKRLVTLEQDVD